MLELYLIIKNTTRNAALAQANGRIGTIAKVYTVMLWLFFYFWGFIFSGALFLEILDIEMDQMALLGVWFIAFVISQLGFFVSWLIAQRPGRRT